MYCSKSCFFSKFSFFNYYCQLRNLLTRFFSVSRDVLAFSGKLVSVYYKAARFLRFKEWHSSREKSILIGGDLLWISISVTNDYLVDLVPVNL